MQPGNRKLLEEFMDENEPWLLIRTPSKDLFLGIQCMKQHFARTDLDVKELMTLRAGLHEMMQCDLRQHLFAERYWLHEHPGRQSSWKESARMKFMNMPSGCTKMRSESSEYMWTTTDAFKKQLENHNSLGELL